MDIPESAIEFVARLSDVTDKCMGSCLADLAEELREGSPRAQRVAAVIEGHARAAQVAILRERADWIESCNNDGSLMVERFQHNIARLMRFKADALEAGAGQAGEGNA